ncbi:MAG: helix-turn-helix domain-containing protein [Sphaerochaeta sp.]|nr:helix-turn-helix domain-containing protein [Sphaerochaeta sp.]
MHSFLANVPTGLVIKQYLDAYGISEEELSLKTGISEDQFGQVLSGSSRLTEEMALGLGKVLGVVPASYWLNYEAKYREAIDSAAALI